MIAFAISQHPLEKPTRLRRQALNLTEVFCG